MSVLLTDPFLVERCNTASSVDQQYMSRALLLAEGGSGWVNPNPLVGCVIVQHGEVIGEGFHSAYGEDHAEVEALKNAKIKGNDVRGATMYVTLEPCVHTGKTPACAPVVAESGVERVVIGLQDPFDAVNGKGIEMLQYAGIDVEVGVMQDVAEYQNRIFIQWVKKVQPFVTVKVAVSADNMITREIGTTTQISAEESMQYTHALRHRHDAIMVGASTIKTDNPFLTVRYGENPHHPVPVIIDGGLSVTQQDHVFERSVGYICTRDDIDPKKISVFSRGIIVLTFPAVNRKIDLSKVFPMLAIHGFPSVLIEGGSDVLTQVLEQDLAHEWIIVRSSETFNTGQTFVSDPVRFYDEYTLHQSVKSGTDTIERYTRRLAK